MAGLGEACTHVGAILFYLKTSTKVNGGHTCTQQKCQWVIPSYQREIPYLPVKDLDFTSAKGKHKALEKALEKSANAGALLQWCFVAKQNQQFSRLYSLIQIAMFLK